mmetsp:Transcript_41023/g.108617  ORF Transcript_41023/g.108617 Transcript_41023/m.108617 type:complete len:201 (-) Transcript_41023:549-1151(-)
MSLRMSLELLSASSLSTIGPVCCMSRSKHDSSGSAITCLYASRYLWSLQSSTILSQSTPFFGALLTALSGTLCVSRKDDTLGLSPLLPARPLPPKPSCKGDSPLFERDDLPPHESKDRPCIGRESWFGSAPSRWKRPLSPRTRTSLSAERLSRCCRSDADGGVKTCSSTSALSRSRNALCSLIWASWRSIRVSLRLNTSS